MAGEHQRFHCAVGASGRERQGRRVDTGSARTRSACDCSDRGRRQAGWPPSPSAMPYRGPRVPWPAYVRPSTHPWIRTESVLDRPGASDRPGPHRFEDPVRENGAIGRRPAPRRSSYPTRATGARSLGALPHPRPELDHAQGSGLLHRYGVHRRPVGVADPCAEATGPQRRRREVSAGQAPVDPSISPSRCAQQHEQSGG